MYSEETVIDYPPLTHRIQYAKDLHDRKLKIGDKLTFLDDSWLLLFTNHRSVGSCIATLSVNAVSEDRYILSVGEIVTTTMRRPELVPTACHMIVMPGPAVEVTHEQVIAALDRSEELLCTSISREMNKRRENIGIIRNHAAL